MRGNYRGSLKILLLFTDIFEERGLQEYNRHLCDALEREFPGIKFIGISLCDLAKHAKTRYWRNIELKCCGRNNLKFLQKASFIFRTVLLVLTENPKFLLSAHVSLSPVALFFKKITGLKYAVLTHGVECWNIRRGIKYSALKNATLIITISEYSKERMVSNGIDEARIKLLHDTVDTSLFCQRAVNPELINLLALKDKRVLLTVGYVSSQERYKGHDIMLEVLKKLDEGYVWLVAGGGDDLPRLREKAQGLGVIDKVRFLGKIPQKRLPDYYNLCNVFVMPSKGEGFGIVYLEAMACGKPVVAGNKDGSPEPLMNGRLGFLVNPDSAREIEEAIKRAFRNKENRTDPEYLRKEVEKNFGIEVFNKRVKEIFRERFQVE